MGTALLRDTVPLNTRRLLTSLACQSLITQGTNVPSTSAHRTCCEVVHSVVHRWFDLSTKGRTCSQTVHIRRQAVATTNAFKWRERTVAAVGDESCLQSIPSKSYNVRQSQNYRLAIETVLKHELAFVFFASLFCCLMKCDKSPAFYSKIL